MHVEAGNVGEAEIGGNRRIAVFREFQAGLGEEDRPRQDMRHDRQRVDARIEDAETAGLPDPVLVGVPVTHVFLPDDVDAADGGGGEERLGGFHGRRITRMPAGEQRQALFIGAPFEVLHFAEGGARRLFEEDVLAGGECRMGCFVAVLRRHAQRNGIDVRHGFQHRADGRIARDALHRAVTARGGRQFVAAVGGDGGEVLVADDLADADDGELDGGHDGNAL